MISSHYKGIEFDLTQLPFEHRTDDLRYIKNKDGVPPNYVLLAFNSFVGEVVHNYFINKVDYERPDRMIYCDHNDWMQYQLIKHLPWEVIVDYFSKRNT